LYQVAIGGSDGILCPSLSEKLCELYEAISSVAAEPKPQESEKDSEHILENFHSSRTIRRLVLNRPGFASILFKKALSGKCRSWAQGHWLVSLMSPLIHPFICKQAGVFRQALKSCSAALIFFFFLAVQRYYLLS